MMNDHFIPNITFGAFVTINFRNTTTFIDCHLIVEHPGNYIELIKKVGANQFIFHCEVTNNVFDLINPIYSVGMHIDLAIKSITHVQIFFIYRIFVDMFLVITIEPGFGGQDFMPNISKKARTFGIKKLHLNIQVDSDLNLQTINIVTEARANCIAVDAIFRTDDTAEIMKKMRKSVDF